MSRTRHARRFLTASATALLLVTSTALPTSAAPAAPAESSPAGAPASTASCDARDFPDVRPGSTFYTPIRWMACEGLTHGYADGTFGVHRQISRGETAAFLYRIADPVHSPPASSRFPDLPSAHSFYAAATWLEGEKIVSGYADGTFKPSRQITRGELAKILHGAARPQNTAGKSSRFSDVSPRSSFYEAIAWLDSSGYSHGYTDGTFRPSRPITRGETAKLMHAVAPLIQDTRGGGGQQTVPKQFTLQGAGWGHGVGMSQFGAAAMARQGHSVTSILGHYYSPATAAYSSTAADRDIRVHLTTDTRTELTGTARVRVRDVGTTGSTVKLSVDGDRVAVELPDGSKKSVAKALVEWEGTRHWNGPASVLTVPRANGSADLPLRHGRVEVSAIKGRLNIVTVLRLHDEYLYGLAEMPSSWPAAALQSQAVAGRSYAVRNAGSVKADCDCHVWDEVRSQKFTGWTKENEGNGTWGARWTAAVDATVRRNSSGTPTSALTLSHGGAVIDAVYSSSTGGHTRANHRVWSGTAIPYLSARPDPYSVAVEANNPYASWSAAIPQDRMARAFGLPDVVSVNIKHDGAGVPQSATARSAGGRTATVTTVKLRAELGLRSAWVDSVATR